MGNLSGLQQIGIGAAGVGVLGSAASGIGQYESGQMQKQAYDYNAAITLQQMQQAQQQTEAEYSNLTGKQASTYAKAGVDVASGSPLLVMAHTAAQGAEQSESEAQAGNEEAALQRYYGQVAAFSGTVGGINSFLSGATKGILQTASILNT